MASFKRGDVCEIVADAVHPERIGLECTVTGPLEPSMFAGVPVYPVRCPHAPILVWAQPGTLKLKRPPQDWKTLCNLTDTPREAETV